MKTKFQLFSLLMAAALFTYAQADSLRITVDGTKGGATCQLAGSNKAYIHSGVGTSPSTSWQIVVGNWGQDDGVGLMTATGNPDEWSITMHLYNYYGVDPNSDTIFNMGLVFRNEDGTIEGKDYSCNDIFIRNLNTANLTVEQSDGSPFDGVTAEWVYPAGINDNIAHVDNFGSFPNPMTESTTISYGLTRNADNITVKILNAVGQEVAVLFDGAQQAGDYSFVWNGTNAAGVKVESGLYFYSITNGNTVVTKKLMVIR